MTTSAGVQPGIADAVPPGRDAAAPEPGPDAAPPPSRTAYVVERLQRDVASGMLRPGQPLRQVHIAQRYGVSVTPVREALRILEAAGTVTYSAHRGATVRDLDPGAVADLYRLRAAVEGLATQMAVERMTPRRLDVIEAAHDAMRRAQAGTSAPGQLSLLNKALHFAIYEGGPSLVREHITSLWTRFPVSTTIWGSDSTARALASDHEAVLAAIRAGDTEAAGTAMAAHVLHAWRLRAGTEPGVEARDEEE